MKFFNVIFPSSVIAVQNINKTIFTSAFYADAGFKPEQKSGWPGEQHDKCMTQFSGINIIMQCEIR